MDIVGILRMVHNVDIMQSILFTEFQQLLLMFQSRSVLNSDSVDSNHDRFLARERLGKILRNADSKERHQFKSDLM